MLCIANFLKSILKMLEALVVLKNSSRKKVQLTAKQTVFFCFSIILPQFFFFFFFPYKIDQIIENNKCWNNRVCERLNREENFFFVQSLFQVCMMPGGGTENMIGNNRTMANIKQEIENPTTPTQNYQVCSPTTTLQHQEVFWTCSFLRSKKQLRFVKM